jgi:NADPH2 dehydrogenase
MKDSLPDDRCIDFYKSRSGNGLYCTIVGNVVIPNGHSTNSSCLQISGDERWANLSSAIKAQGARPGIQLSTAWEAYTGVRSFKPPSQDISIEQYKLATSQLSTTQVLEIFKALDYGTELALKANFEHIQLHAAHGYFFSLIIDSNFSSKSELGIKLIQDWIARFRSSDIEISLRVSLSTGIQSIDSTRQLFLDSITALDCNYFDLSDGFYNINKKQIYPTTPSYLNIRHNTSIELSLRNPTKNFIISGKANTLTESDLPSNISVGFCRDFIANPNFLVNPTFKCTDCMHCHYYSRNKSNITCKHW